MTNRDHPPRVPAMTRLAGACAAFCLLLSPCLATETYPVRPIEMVVGLAAGGAGDLSARTISKHLEKHLKVPFVVVNKPGAAQMVAAAHVANAKPDGYTIGHMTNAIVVAELTGTARGYSVADLLPVCQLGGAGSVLVASADAPFTTYQEFVAHARQHPGMTAGHQGNGSANHMRLEILGKQAGLAITAVPFKGEAEALNMLMGRHLDIAAVSPAAAKPQLETNKLRALLAWEDPRAHDLPASIPTLASVYGPGKVPDIGVSNYLWVPKKTPAHIVRALDEACALLMRDPAFTADFAKGRFPLIHVSREGLASSMDEKLVGYKEALKIMETLKK